MNSSNKDFLKYNGVTEYVEAPLKIVHIDRLYVSSLNSLTNPFYSNNPFMKLRLTDDARYRFVKNPPAAVDIFFTYHQAHSLSNPLSGFIDIYAQPIPLLDSVKKTFNLSEIILRPVTYTFTNGGGASFVEDEFSLDPDLDPVMFG